MLNVYKLSTLRIHIIMNVVYPQKYPLPEVLCGSYLLTDYRPDLITMVLDKLVPETMRYDLE